MKLALLLNRPPVERAISPNGVETFTTSIQQYSQILKAAEAAKLDFAFTADSSSGAVLDSKLPHLEPMTLFSAMAGFTERIGLVVTASTTFNEPYNLARQLLSLDHLSNGRAGWNMVVSSDGEKSFSDKPLPVHADRYRRANEFVEVVQKLWATWGRNAVMRHAGEVASVDTGQLHQIKHRGEFFSVEAQLSHERSIQGRPVLLQAGSSEQGKQFAARYAEAVYTAQPNLQSAQTFYATVKKQTAAAGRNPDHVKILPGICTVVGETEAAAQQLNHEILGDCVNAESLSGLAKQFDGAKLDDLGADDVIPPERLSDISTVQGRRSRFSVFYDRAVNDRWTIRQLIELFIGSNGHGRVVGSPEQVASFLEHWFRSKGSDGFVVMPGQGPGGDRIFLEQVVPILQRRGVFRKEYEADTLRGNLGLDGEIP
ncbi:MAG: NtaA/DmoA family FMN-dependent monooxygenase [Steroidobacteraceae bacterium]